MSRPPMGPMSLRGKLVASVIALFLIVSTATGIATVFALDRSLTAQVDESLLSLNQRLGGPAPQDRDDRHPDRGPGPGGASNVLRLAYNESTGLVSTNLVYIPGGDSDQLEIASIDRIKAAGVGPHPQTVDLGDTFGSYRLVANSMTNAAGDHIIMVVGLPMAGINHTRNEMLLFVGCGIGAGLLLVGLGGAYLIRRNLRPLDRVAATAQKVSTQQLAEGEVTLAERVPAELTDPRTEVGQVGFALNSLLDNVDGALRARQDSETRVRQFVADASHELRTPLASMKGYAELSRREREPVPSGVTHALGRIESEAGRMSSLVEDLLLLARLDAGRPLEREAVDLSMLAVETIGDIHAASRDHVWELDLPDEPVEVVGDRQRLQQVLINLLGNARAHTPAGTKVVLGVRRDGPLARISVTDNGPGIPEELQAHVFARFTRGDEARNRAAGSTGLGLSIVEAVTQAHGGSVALESRPGMTRFTVSVPADGAAASTGAVHS